MAGQSVAENWQKINTLVQSAQKKSSWSANDICIIGVSKLQSNDVISQGIEAGVHDLGENYVQELSEKIKYFDNKKLKWHLIGPLQSNKAKQVVGHVEMIHTLDRESLAQTVSKLAVDRRIRQKVLIQVNVAKEGSKSGVSVEEAEEFSSKIAGLQGLDIQGLMTMPPISDEAESSREYFKMLRQVRDKLNMKVFAEHRLRFLSMGTSQDFEVAVEEGATHIRVGSILFGQRKK